jgi:serine/threonine protein kinase
MRDDGERERLLAAALADFLDRQARDEAIDPGSFCRLHPDLAADLGPQLEALAEIDELADASAAPGVPERLSGYRILCEIGTGGMGRVLLAIDERLNRKVAIKTLGPRYAVNASLRARFMQEARAMARVEHPNIARIYSLGPDDEPPHFVMEHVEGISLTGAARALTVPQKAALMRKVALAVDVLHQHGVIHRDLKPANVLVGADLEPKLLDFGLALDVSERKERLTHPG